MIVKSVDSYVRIYPIFCVAVAFIAGIWWYTCQAHLLITFTVAIVGAGLLTVTRRFLHAFVFPYPLLYALCFLVGYWIHFSHDQHQKKFCLQTNNTVCNVLGIVTNIERTNSSYMRYALTLSIVSLTPINDPDAIMRDQCLIRLYTNRIGSITLSDTIFAPHLCFKEIKNTSLLRFLLKDNIMTSVTAVYPIDVIARPVWSWWRTMYRSRTALLEKFCKILDPQTYSLFASIFLGNPVAKKNAPMTKNRLRMWGLFHYIARAGLHLTLFIAIWMFLISFLPISLFIRNLIMIILCGIYFLLTWSSIPFNRAFFTFLGLRACTLMRVRAYYIPVLCIIAMGVLVLSPTQLFCLDFQLSFGVTYALAWFNDVRTYRQ